MDINTSALIMNPGFIKMPERPSKVLKKPTESEARELRPEHVAQKETELSISETNELLQATNTGVTGGIGLPRPTIQEQIKTESKFPKKEAMILGGVLLVVIVGLFIYSHSKSKK
ncbi:hypothetical protein [Brumimicrobium mesophilum]|uniref:hypothetical protein n=1 Tax=Brumimicrobium mesophilum TaxID=392717 RepID=UPI000D141664|nr:hypothetical protein [Brumimicrobium mesophilum]